MTTPPFQAANPAEELLTVAEAATRISMSARYVRRLIAERRIVFYRLGRSVRIDPADLTTFITSSRVEPLTSASVWNELRSVA
jgi:excisionase family DNA binding protein